MTNHPPGTHICRRSHCLQCMTNCKELPRMWQHCHWPGAVPRWQRIGDVHKIALQLLRHMFHTFCTYMSLSSCRHRFFTPEGVPGTTMVMREQPMDSHGPTARLCTLYPLRANTAVTCVGWQVKAACMQVKLGARTSVVTQAALTHAMKTDCKDHG